MDQELLRRDEIWFVERNKENISHLFSLDCFKERYGKKLSKAYLEGRYCAVPVKGANVGALIEQMKEDPRDVI